MPPSNLAAYLAKNYLTASNSTSSEPTEPPKKKRKKSKHQTATSGLVIADDDEDLRLSAARNDGANEDDDVDTPMMYEGKARSAEFRKAKKVAWQPLAKPESGTLTSAAKTEGDDGHDDDADTLLRTAQSDEARRLAEQEAENAPTVVEMDVDKDSTPRMESGLRAGLQTAADTARLVAEEEAAAAAAREQADRKALKKSKKKRRDEDNINTSSKANDAVEEETIYRDATGRRIDISQRRAEARREEAEKARAKEQERIDAMGDVQRREREERRKDLDEAKFLTLGRSVEDDEYNERLKEQARWDDPMAAYMAERRAEEEEQEAASRAKDGRAQRGSAGVGVGAGGKLAVRKKEYQGAAPPNRYGIKPGWRWDGVDRGNGFEKEWFQARSKRSRNEALSYEWQMDE